MGKYLAIVKKEFLQVVRDLPGLGLLFLMPALMLILITLTQEKVMTGMDTSSKVLLVNSDGATLGNSIEEELNRESKIELKVMKSVGEAEKLVYTGKYRLLVVVPDSSTEKLEDLAWDQAFDMGEIDSARINKLTGIRLLYDPAMMKLYKDIMGYSLQRIIESAAIDLYLDALQEALETNITNQFDQNLVTIEEGIAGGSEFLLEYNIVNNNVPAFILFAMFFIVIPLAGSILHEKQQGTRDRIMTLPVSWITLLLGKITVYLLVCLAQFSLMIAIGRYLIPQICDLPPLSLDVNLFAMMSVTIASGLAAVGFGLLIGSLSSTFMQAAPIGSVLVVILAILGGIFVPNYMMPELVSKISFISPMRWGADAYFNIFAREAGMGMVFHQFFLLLTFFIVSLAISFYSISKRA
ncbi:MAG: ABC transporter permease [Bacteroidetes bacterium]|nr:ABC transporter permease [Bacteroidota bacterium]